MIAEDLLTTASSSVAEVRRLERAAGAKHQLAG
jgi:hypothetical protein